MKRHIINQFDLIDLHGKFGIDYCLTLLFFRAFIGFDI